VDRPVQLEADVNGRPVALATDDRPASRPGHHRYRIQLDATDSRLLAFTLRGRAPWRLVELAVG
jgi:hypothetical protein